MADQIGIEEQGGHPGWGGHRHGAGRPRADQHQRGIRLWVPYRDDGEAGKMRSVPPAERRTRLLGYDYVEIRGETLGDVACGYRDGDTVVVSVRLQGAAEEVFTVQTDRPVDAVVREELDRRLIAG